MRWLCTEQILGPGGYGISNHQVNENDGYSHPGGDLLYECEEDLTGPFLRLESEYCRYLEYLLEDCRNGIRKKPQADEYLIENLSAILQGQDENWGLVSIGFSTKVTELSLINVKISDDGERYIDDTIFIVLNNDDGYREFFVNVPGWDGTVSERYQVTTEEDNVHINEYRDGKFISDAELYLEKVGDEEVEKIRTWEYRR